MNFFEQFWTGLTDGLKGGVKSLTGNYTPQEKQNIINDFKKAQQNNTSLGDSIRITGNVVKNGGQYNPNDSFNVTGAIIVGLGALVLLKILD